MWTVELAREAAKKVIGKLASGTNPNEPVGADRRPLGPTVREGVETHLAKMQEEGQDRERSIRNVHARDEQVPGRLARSAVLRADRREARRAASTDQGSRGEAHRDEPGERQGRAAREPRDRARVRVVALVEQEARGQARHAGTRRAPSTRTRSSRSASGSWTRTCPTTRRASRRCARRSSATA